MSPNTDKPSVAAVLFDLDGTLADTAPDLADALNHVRQSAGLERLPYNALRPYTSQGTRGLILAGLGVEPQDDCFPGLRDRFLAFYGQNLCKQSRLFPGIEALLGRIEAAELPWGIVTNKPDRYTQPLCDLLGLSDRAACIVSGDTCQRSKPAPDPLLYAADLLRLDRHHCLYIGDDIRDIEAGKAAGMKTLAVRYGYLGVGPPIEQWGADAIADTVEMIADLCLPYR